MVDKTLTVYQQENAFLFKLTEDMEKGLELLNVERNKIVKAIEYKLRSLDEVLFADFRIKDHGCEWIFDVILDCDEDIDSENFIALTESVHDNIEYLYGIEKFRDILNNSFIACKRPK